MNFFGICVFIMVFCISCTTKERAEAKKWFNMGDAKLENGDYTGAKEDYTKAIEIDSTFAYAYSRRALTKINLDDHTGAKEDYTKAIEFDPDYARFYFFRGLINVQLEDFNAACPDLEKAKKLGMIIADTFLREHCR